MGQLDLVHISDMNGIEKYSFCFFFTSLFFTAMQVGFDWWLVTLVVDFGFLTQNFGRWRGPTNNSFAQNERSLSRADN